MFKKLIEEMQRIGINPHPPQFIRKAKPKWFKSKVVRHYTMAMDYLPLHLYTDSTKAKNLVRVTLGHDIIIASLKKSNIKAIDFTDAKLARLILNAIKAQAEPTHEFESNLTKSDLQAIIDDTAEDEITDNYQELYEKLTGGSGYYLILDNEDKVWSDKEQDFTNSNQLMTPYKKMREAISIAKENTNAYKVIKV